MKPSVQIWHPTKKFLEDICELGGLEYKRIYKVPRGYKLNITGVVDLTHNFSKLYDGCGTLCCVEKRDQYRKLVNYIER